MAAVVGGGVTAPTTERIQTVLNSLLIDPVPWLKELRDCKMVGGEAASSRSN
jgi:hypothetical protein